MQHDEIANYTVCIMKSGQNIFIEDIVESIQWSGATNTAARKLAFTYNIVDGADVTIGPGDVVALTRVESKLEIIRAIVVDKSISGSNKTVSITAYDARWWLLKSKHDKIYRNMTAADIIKSCCSEFGVPVGSLANSSVKHESLQIVNKTVWDTIIIALTETRKVNGKKLITKMIKGKLNLVEKVKQTHQWVIENAVNLLESNYSESISDMYTQVKATGKTEDKTELSALAKNDAMIKKYGVLQELVNQSEAKTQSEITAIANQRLKELAVLKKSGSITALGKDEIEAGDGIYVVDSVTGLIGGFWVESDDHKVSNRHHTMLLKLAWTDELPSIDYEPPKDEEEKTTSKTSKKK